MTISHSNYSAERTTTSAVHVVRGLESLVGAHLRSLQTLHRSHPGRVTVTWKHLLIAPALNSTDLSRLHSYRGDYLIVGVVCDSIGRHTKRVLDAGATGVLNTLLDPWVWASGMLSQWAEISAERQQANVLETLSEADHQLMSELARGASTLELAQKYFISERSMYRRLRDLYARLGVRSREEAVVVCSTVNARLGSTPITLDSISPASPC